MDPSPFDDNDLPVEDNANDLDAFGGDNAGDDDPFGLPGTDDNQDYVDVSKEDGDDDPFGASNANEPAQEADLFAGTEQKHDTQQSTALRQWEEERAKLLAKRQTEYEEKKSKQVQDAEASIDTFYDQRKENISKAAQSSRLDEENTKKDMQSLMENGSGWEKVAKLVDLQAKTNEGRGLGRMRRLLLELKAAKADVQVSKKK